MDNLPYQYKLMTWNVRGLNGSAKQEDVKQVISIYKPDLVCLQETKLASVSHSTILNVLGHEYEDSFMYLPASGTRGGIILASRASVLQLQQSHLTANTITASVQDIRLNDQWSVTGIYGPQEDFDKKMFLRQIKRLKQNTNAKWLLLGDFNLIYQDEDKNNGRLNRRMMLRFRRALNSIEVKEIPLTGRRFTWSSQQNTPTLTRIDRAFCSPEWEEAFVNPILQPLSSSSSDHCPLLLTSLNMPRPCTRFRFETWWTQMPGFHQQVQLAWDRPVPQEHNAMLTLHIKLSRVAKALRAWSKTLIPQGKLAAAVCREVIAQLETAQENRILTTQELDFLKQLKNRVLGLSAIEKSRARQQSRLTWLRKGDANTKYFQLMVNMRKRKNFMHSIQTDGGLASSQSEKQRAVYGHFVKHIGTYTPRSCKLNFTQFGWQPRDLHHLDLPFQEHEVLQVIKHAPKEKAPGPDGFIGSFFAECWDTIKNDLLQAINQFYSGNQQGLHLLNQALVVLIPKKSNPTRLTDYRPISLTHSFSKIISKLLANRLAPELDHLISVNQTAFIKRRVIHDNFVYVQETIKKLHKEKTSALFIKLDISKAFDTVNWPYLIDIMTFLGFGQRWRDWIAMLWCTASSAFLVNGEPGRRILHCKGVRQGDPLSPMIFLLAMEPLHRLFRKAQEQNLLQKINSSCDSFRVSLYADDAAVFIRPSYLDIKVADCILSIFQEASGLVTNFDKTEYYPIRCSDQDMMLLLNQNLNLAQFPCTYLGLPLHLRKPTRAMLQPVVQKIGDRLPGWKRRFLTYPGRELLVKTVLTAMPTYFLTVFSMPKWGIKRIDRFRRSFFWKGRDPDQVRGGHCLVNWETCLRPKKWGGLGFKDLEKFGRALRLRWLWHQWDEKDRPWKGLLKIKDPTDRQLFFCSTTVNVGNGLNTPFWEARWLNGAAPKELAPNLYETVRYKFRNVCQQIRNFNWIRNLGEINTPTLLEEYMLLFMALSTVELTNNRDTISWRWTRSGQYTVASAYEIQFKGAITLFPARDLWSAAVEPKCRFFAWLAMHDRVLTADNLAKRNWPHNEFCILCLAVNETTDHLLTQCNYTEALWNLVASRYNLPRYQELNNVQGTKNWILSLRQSNGRQVKRRNLGILFYCWWHLWKERNRRIFEGEELPPHRLTDLIHQDIANYNTAFCV